jgi:hypothetical protein
MGSTGETQGSTRRMFSAAMLAAAFGAGAVRVAAADATPAADAATETSGYLVVRHWQLVAGTDYAAFTEKVRTGYVPILREVEGFVAYYFANPGDDEHVAVAIFTSKEGADASTVAARDWTAANLAGVVEGDPLAVIEAEIWMTASPLGVESRV